MMSNHDKAWNPVQKGVTLFRVIDETLLETASEITIASKLNGPNRAERIGTCARAEAVTINRGPEIEPTHPVVFVLVPVTLK